VQIFLGIGIETFWCHHSCWCFLTLFNLGEVLQDGCILGMASISVVEVVSPLSSHGHRHGVTTIISPHRQQHSTSGMSIERA
jgi:hypothetical protein